MHVDVCKGKAMECLIMGGSGVGYHMHKHTPTDDKRG